MCDRVVVLNRGHFSAELAGTQLSEDAIVHSYFVAA
jgi:ABC-type sugar transport system ATPase subunit